MTRDTFFVLALAATLLNGVFVVFSEIDQDKAKIRALEMEVKEARERAALYQESSLQHLKDSSESLQLGNTAWEIHTQKMKEVNDGLQILCEGDAPSPVKLRKACLAWSATRTP